MRYLILALALLFTSEAFAVPPDSVVITGYRKPYGYQQLTNAVLQSSVGLTAPGGSGYAVIQCQGGSVRWRDDGTAPTSSVGMTIPSGGELDYVGEMTGIRFISASGTPICDVNLYY